MATIGDRVGAIQKSNETEVHLYGYGKFLGFKKHPDLGVPNPCIELDGTKKLVWGCECWWGPEDRIKSMTTGKKIINVPIT